ncbi:carboxymuconolactone decarboxylase family protein [Flectobacillus sp. BAB-3569]|uniref:carboxymuconolactone decarboxylase family protein n=1 Tax=Flectobacillus sp. BAB-3569 TaxID=1509483 RepID=UPI000BA3F366|nr:peroxidase-related enzyme [Flectobacillus sp. BAB-3569]PAC29969.1 carboxymuconolactone decarboxylase [Flectobacillus sp. BAB-3569]
MSYITLPNPSLPGISGLLNYNKTTAQPLLNLAEVFLRGESTLSSGERELIAAHVSYLNNCHFCHTSHAAAAVAHLNCDISVMDDIKKNFVETPISPKLRALLDIAGKVQKGGKQVLPEDIAIAREAGASDRELHDTVLISAAFCMFNRYVDGLGTWAPQEASAYLDRGPRIRDEGYANFDPIAYIKG